MKAPVLILISLVFGGEAPACSYLGEISNTKVLNGADAIVRAIAVDYVSPPVKPQTPRPAGSTAEIYPAKAAALPRVTFPGIRFKVIETIRGIETPELILPGNLVEEDDFNDKPAPYSVVRPDGRGGSCYARSYRKGSQFLLFLKKDAAGKLTADWAPLSPANEQLHSENDPWLLWAREHAQK
jgi:hypothetical protein